MDLAKKMLFYSEEAGYTGQHQKLKRKTEENTKNFALLLPKKNDSSSSTMTRGIRILDDKEENKRETERRRPVSKWHHGFTGTVIDVS